MTRLEIILKELPNEYQCIHLNKYDDIVKDSKEFIKFTKLMDKKKNIIYFILNYAAVTKKGEDKLKNAGIKFKRVTKQEVYTVIKGWNEEMPKKFSY